MSTASPVGAFDVTLSGAEAVAGTWTVTATRTVAQRWDRCADRYEVHLELALTSEDGGLDEMLSATLWLERADTPVELDLWVPAADLGGTLEPTLEGGPYDELGVGIVVRWEDGWTGEIEVRGATAFEDCGNDPDVDEDCVSWTVEPLYTLDSE